MCGLQGGRFFYTTIRSKTQCLQTLYFINAHQTVSQLLSPIFTIGLGQVTETGWSWLVSLTWWQLVDWLSVGCQSGVLFVI